MQLNCLFSFVFSLCFLSCSSHDLDSKPDTTDTIKVIQKAGESIDGVRIAWDYSSIGCISPKGWYARARRLQDNSLVAVYDDQTGNSAIRWSYDNGKSWSEPRNLFTAYIQNSVLIYTVNPEIIQLQNGDLIVGCNDRPIIDNVVPFSISIRLSKDMGKTWSAPQIIYEGQSLWNDGCWEPTFLQLPNGDLQMYFSDEGRFLTTDEQETRMMTSHDNGLTWDAIIKNVSYRSNARDGMPVPIIVGDEILVSIESNPVWELLRPNILRTEITNPWPFQLLADSQERTESGISFSSGVRGAAPYIVRIPSGEVILSYQTNGNRTDTNDETVEVAIGDKTGRNFSKLSRPFNLSLEKSATWNSIMLWDSTSVAVVSSVNYNSTTIGAWFQIGHIIPELIAEQASPTIDGAVTEAEWGKTFPIFIGSTSNSNLKAAVRYDAGNLYVAALVKDENLFVGNVNADGFNLYLDPQNSKYTTIGSKQYRIWCSYNGSVKVYQGKNGSWIEQLQNSVTAMSKTDANYGGYTVEMKIPLDAINKTDKNPMRLTLDQENFSTDTNGYSESVIFSNVDKPCTWLEVGFAK
jgi:hypothetical protein